MGFLVALEFIAGLILCIVIFDRFSRMEYRLHMLEKKLSAEQPAPTEGTKKETDPLFTDPVQAAGVAQIDKKEPAPAVCQASADISQPQTPEPQTDFAVTSQNTLPQEEPVLAKETQPSAEQTAKKPIIDWENFTAAKLFSWIGGFTLLLAVGFAAKYSLDNNLLSPALRMSLGALLGLCLLAAGLFIKKETLQTTANTLAGSGLAVLYICIFAAHAFYHLFGMETAFALMAGTGLLSFSVAMWKNAKYIGFLAEITCFLTPFLLTSDNPNIIFFLSYVAFINAAAAFTAFKRGWNGLLIGAAVCTFLCQSVAASSCLTLDGHLTAFCFFGILYTAAAVWAALKKDTPLSKTARYICGLFITANLLFAAYGASEFARHLTITLPLLGFALYLNGLLVVLARKEKEVFTAPLLIGKILAFLTLLCWTLNAENISPVLMLTSFLAFAALNGASDLLDYKKQAAKPGLFSLFFPVLLMLPLLFKAASFGPGAFMAAIAVMICLLSLCAVCALLAGKPLATLAAGAIFILTLLVADLSGSCVGPLWLLPLGLIPSLLVFAAARLLLRGTQQGEAQAALTVFISALMPYVLLLAAVFSHKTDAHLFFGFALLLNLLCVLFAYLYKNAKLLPAALIGSTLAQITYVAAHAEAAQSPILISWTAGIFAVFFITPFLCKKRFFDQLSAWATSALSGVPAVLLIYELQRLGENATNGTVCLIFTAVYILGLYLLQNWAPAQEPLQRKRLAWMGGTALFFITLFFPLQFSKTWLTVSWALEGTALVWLNRRLLVKGLRTTGFFLLAIVFIRLLCCTLETEPVTGLFNRYLYIFGLSASAMLAAAHWWEPREETAWIKWLQALGGIALFILMNLEIAFYFSPEELRFDVFGPFSSAIAYTVGWTVFGAVCLFLGLGKRGGTRTVGLGLVGIALLKLFFSDIWSLGGLYRIAGLAGIAAVLLLISFMYQKFKQK